MGVSRVFKGRTVSHQGGSGENATAVRLHDPPVHAGRETEVVGINHQ
jgi:hypothetical protein